MFPSKDLKALHKGLALVSFPLLYRWGNWCTQLISNPMGWQQGQGTEPWSPALWPSFLQIFIHMKLSILPIHLLYFLFYLGLASDLLATHSYFVRDSQLAVHHYMLYTKSLNICSRFHTVIRCNVFPSDLHLLISFYLFPRACLHGSREMFILQWDAGY